LRNLGSERVTREESHRPLVESPLESFNR
jgi:hypothetical protein